MNGIIKGHQKVGTVTQDSFGNLTKHTTFGAYCLFDDTGSIDFVPNFTKVNNVTDILKSKHDVKFRECDINGRRCSVYDKDILLTGETNENKAN